MLDHNELAQRTREWIDADPDPSTRQELEALLEAEDWAELTERMGGVLRFGTAGIRGAVQAGSNRMNRAVVIRTTAGLADFLKRERSGHVVVGFDARSSSPQFAEDTVGVLVAAGIDVSYFPHPVPTPIVAYTARKTGAAAAVVITASHNPPADNGYKVYDSNGAQIIPPVDTAISEAIDRIGPARDVPRIEHPLGPDSPARRLDFEEIYDAYRRDVDAVRPRREGSSITVAYTPIHGVGWATFQRLVTDAGYPNVEAVAEQRDPDGRFPTVSFPNPEEPGAMDLVEKLGTRIGADLVLANDPDADRLAVAVPDGAGGWRALTGNQIGVLLADYLLQNWSGGDRPMVINSIVSSPMLQSVAELYRAHFDQTLTGFKWIANAALELEAKGVGTFVFGYEEALGYTVGGHVRDKDGLSAGLVFLDLAATLRDEGQTVIDRMADLYERAGLWVSTQLSLVRPGTEGLAEIAGAMELLGERTPSELDGRKVVSVRDFRVGAEERPRWLPATDLVEMTLEGGGRVLVRPSGTEPKLKIYVDLPGSAEGDIALQESETRAAADRIAAATARFIGL
ncbi:MAG TPA: phospho-sugar mutase [Acidimicrobiia bacterium]|jgi:phosphomannomutase